MSHSHHHGHHHHHPHGHGHHHGHEHGHDHGDVAVNSRQVRVLRWVFFLTLFYLVVEIVGGWMTGSLALLADGIHMFADATAIGISLFAAWFAHKPSSDQRTFGYQRVEIIAAFFNALLLILMGVFILLESFERFQNPQHINAIGMMIIATGGLLINIASAWLLHRDMHANLNIKGAYLHVLGDLLGSIGAIAAGVVILFWHWGWMDPLISGLVSVLVFTSAAGLLKDAMGVLMEGCPAHLDVEEIRRTLQSYEGIEAVHHLHVWNIDMQRIVLTAHLEVTAEAFSGQTLTSVQDALKEQFGLSHVTLQMELA